MNGKILVDDLTYKSYCYQRALHGMTARQCANIFDNAETLEERYQSDPKAQHMRKERVLAETRAKLGPNRTDHLQTAKESVYHCIKALDAIEGRTARDEFALTEARRLLDKVAKLEREALDAELMGEES